MDTESNGTAPILCAHLLRKVDGKLIELLASLSPSEWDLPTIAGSWTVRDVAAHLLDTPSRKVSLARDSWFAEPVQPSSSQELVQLINRLNHEGVVVYRRLSSAVMIEMMKLACELSACYHESLDPFAPAKFAVTWAGEESSPNWFDTARELTERWHHQQQIRLAVDRPGIMTPELYHPVLDCFIRAMPHAYRDVSAPAGTAVALEISGDCGGHWFLVRTPIGWGFGRPLEGEVVSNITIPEEIAWRLFTKGLNFDSAARSDIHIKGDAALAEHMFQVTAIIG